MNPRFIRKKIHETNDHTRMLKNHHFATCIEKKFIKYQSTILFNILRSQTCNLCIKIWMFNIAILMF